MKKLDPRTLCETFNKVRLANQNRKFLREELDATLTHNGFNSTLIAFMKSANWFKVYKDGSRRYYVFPESPIYQAQFVSLLTKQRERGRKKTNDTPSSEQIEASIKLLKSAGYRIQKEEGLNVDLFKKEQPQLFEKYIILKEI